MLFAGGHFCAWLKHRSLLRLRKIGQTCSRRVTPALGLNTDPFSFAEEGSNLSTLALALRMALRVFGHRIVPAAAPGMAAQNALHAEEAPFEHAPLPHRLHEIARAGGGKPAMRAGVGGDRLLIEFHRQQKRLGKKFPCAQESSPASERAERRSALTACILLPPMALRATTTSSFPFVRVGSSFSRRR